MTTKDKGDRLERRVERVLSGLGHTPVRRNVIIKDGNGNRSEIDLVAGRWFPLYVECKNYSHPVPLEQVAKFKEVLALNHIPIRRGLFVTTATFTPRATTIGVETWDGAKLRRMERRAALYRLLRPVFRFGVLIPLSFASLLAVGPPLLDAPLVRRAARAVDVEVPVGQFRDALAAHRDFWEKRVRRLICQTSDTVNEWRRQWSERK